MTMVPLYQYSALVYNVVDGDTIDAVIDLGFKITSTHRLRLLRVDTPELNAKDQETRDKALAAKEYVKTMVLDKDVVIKTEKADSFGRYLADVWIDDVNLSDALLEAGYAVPYVKK